jgi:hypothetical protein
MKRVLSGIAALLLVGGLGAALPTAATAAPYCGITWGSTRESRSGFSTSQITNVRSGQHACFDRLVIDLDDDVTGYSVKYVSTVHRPGSGFAVPLRGGADLEIIVNAPTYNVEIGHETYHPRDRDNLVNVTDYRTFRQAALAGSFEGESTFGLGVRARLPFRTTVLDGPGDGSRLVIDVAHKW